MNDFRSHLWDIFVYIGIGALILMLLGVQDWLHSSNYLMAAMAFTEKVPSTLVVILFPTVLMLAGALVEPLANGFEKVVIWIWNKTVQEESTARSGMLLESYIQKHFTDQILGKGASPYSLCKEYVETNGLSTTFMPFLAKFGFYRSAAYCFLMFALIEMVHVGGSAMGEVASVNVTSLIAVSISLALAGVYLHRSRQFFSYQAPAVYAAFLGPVLTNLLKSERD